MPFRFGTDLPLFVIAILMILICAAGAIGADSRHKIFGQFSVDLPPGWDGDEQTGFVSDNPGEYALTMAKKDASGDKFLAQVSVYLLPNKPGTTSREAAAKLAEAQADVSPPRAEGNFWVFTGEPRSNAIKGIATTMVNANPRDLLIIIAQDPQELGAKAIMESLKGETPRARQLLGR